MEASARIPTIEEWVAHLDGLASGPLSGVPLDGRGEEKRLYIDRFEDEFGSRRATDRALLCRVLGIEYARGSLKSKDLDFLLWEAVHGVGDQWRGLIRDSDGLVDPHGYAIEHRTLIELCGLHAIMHLDDGSLGGRIEDLVDWHTRELQPDNGINRPWGVHAFVVRSVEAEDERTRLDAMLHAQTLVNNCCITLGRPDVLSAFILLDGAEALRSHG
jgi:hypothetical protein